jgi:hypothetical protein
MIDYCSWNQRLAKRPQSRELEGSTDPQRCLESRPFGFRCGN